MKKQELILVPEPGISHMVRMLEFANCLLNRNDQITVTVLVMKLPSASLLDSCIKTDRDSNSRIQFIQLPEIAYPPYELMVKAFLIYLDAAIESYKPHVRTVVSEIISSRSRSQHSTQVAGLILDFFCVSMIDIAKEFCIPSYVYFTSGAGVLSFMLSIPDLHKEVGREFGNSNPDYSLSSFSKLVPVQVLPSAVFNTDGDYATYVKMSSRFREAKGIVVNTFAELESYAINALSEEESPKIYPGGPLLNLKPNLEQDRDRWDRIMKWLDEQPESSVLFLCFGSYGSFSAPQVEELASGIKKSGYRFLWCLRAPLGEQDKKPEDILPEGFLERIGDRGVICQLVPQVELLGHKAIGGFMSPCGWNSILESLWHGVPIVALPIHAEQQLNAFIMVKELGIAEELSLDYRPGHLVKAEKIERAVRRVMRSDNMVRKKVKEMKEMARKAVMEGGSSSASITKFIKDMTNNNENFVQVECGNFHLEPAKLM